MTAPTNVPKPEQQGPRHNVQDATRVAVVVGVVEGPTKVDLEEVDGAASDIFIYA